ncbi:MAG: hypothetical protein K2P07_12225, partial [Lachnospiraceae bacterium]|nr:hypothetical protein [Lachnospiraceae bacterium]
PGCIHLACWRLSCARQGARLKIFFYGIAARHHISYGVKRGKGASVGIVEKPLINYRTAPVSPNIKSMEKRLELIRYLINKHKTLYQDHVEDALLGMEAISISRLYGWECEILHARRAGIGLSDSSNEFINSPSYGDGGMAAAVRIVSADQ